jgi:hypothetical protein
LVSPSPMFQVPKEILAHVCLESQTLNVRVFSFGQSRYQAQSERVQMSNLLTCPFCTLCYLSLDLSISQGVLESRIWHPFKKTQNRNTYNVHKRIQMLVAMKSRWHWKNNL